MYKLSRILLGAMWLFSGYQVAAQSLTNSPYSRLGIGELNTSSASIRNFSMGGAGVAAPNSAQINDINPALLFYNNFVTFEMGVAGELKQLANQDQRQILGDANLSYLALSVPIAKGWSAAVGLKPYSNVDYQTSSQENVQNSPGAAIHVLKAYEGEGGLSEAYFAHGVRIAKGLSVGVTGSYVFGTINNDASTVLRDTANPALSLQKTVFSTRTNYSDFMFKGGLHYRHSVKDKIFFSLGGVYGLAADLDGTRRTVLQRKSVETDGVLPGGETVLEDSIRGSVHIPQFLSIGLGIDNGKNWGAGLDFSSQKWSQFRPFRGLPDMIDAYRISLGGEITPNMASMDSYLQRITYRAGVSYARTPLVVDGTTVDDIAFTWGASLPVGRLTAIQRSFLNLGFAVGRRGNLSENPIRETYLRFQVGLSLNNRWFIKRMVE